MQKAPKGPAQGRKANTENDCPLARFAALAEAAPVGLNSTRPNNDRENLWEKKCPIEYRETDSKRLPCDRETIAKVYAWPLVGASLLLYGPPRRGKTRLAWMLCRKHYLTGASVLAMDAPQFSAEASGAYRDGKEGEFFARMVKPEILFVDDAGKTRMTDRTLEALFTVIERRGARRKAMLITINGKTEDLLAKWLDREKLDPETAGAIIARLDEWPGKILIRGAA